MTLELFRIALFGESTSRLKISKDLKSYSASRVFLENSCVLAYMENSPSDITNSYLNISEHDRLAGKMRT